MRIITVTLDDYDQPHVASMVVNDDALQETLDKLRAANTQKTFTINWYTPDSLEETLAAMKEVDIDVEP